MLDWKKHFRSNATRYTSAAMTPNLQMESLIGHIRYKQLMSALDLARHLELLPQRGPLHEGVAIQMHGKKDLVRFILSSVRHTARVGPPINLRGSYFLPGHRIH
jgi:hypothetical protein